MDEDYEGGDNRVAELIGGGDEENSGIEVRATDVKIRGSGNIRTGKRPQLQIQIDDGRYGEMSETRNAKLKESNRFGGGRGNLQQQYDDTEQGAQLPSVRGAGRPEPYRKHPLRPTRGELAEAAFWRALTLGFPLNLLGFGGMRLGGYGALGGHRNFGLFF